MNGQRFFAIFIFILVLFSFNALGQGFTMQLIEHNLIYNPPTLGNETLREQTILDLDNILSICGAGGINCPDVEQFYFNMIKKVKAELKQTIKGTSIWMMYNHGFIVKTEHNIFAIDLIRGYSGWWSLPVFPQDIIDQIQVLLITHSHSDHYDNFIKVEVLFNNGYVIEPSGTFPNPYNVGMMPGDSVTIHGLKIKAHDGLHSVPVRIYEIVTPDSTKYMHTGDNQTSATLPQVSGIDYLFLNCWVNESGSTSPVTGMRNCINLLKPRYMIPGHMQELGHNISYRIGSYHDVYQVDDIPLPSKVQVMAWGERYILNKGYKNFYVYKNSTDKNYLKPNQDSLLIKSEIYNPQNRNLNVTASITSFDSTFQDSIILYDDGNHHDSLAHDGIYANHIKPVTIDNYFHVNAYVTDIDSGLYFYMDDFTVFSSAGPVDVDSFTLDTLIGDYLFFTAVLKNEGSYATVQDIKMRMLSDDSLITNIPINSQNFGSIAPGGTATSPNNYAVKISNLPVIHTFNFTFKIFSNGSLYWNDSINVDIINNMDAEDDNIPKVFALRQNYPNPFNPETNIEFSIPKAEYVTLKIFNLLGQEVATLVSDKLTSGNYTYAWDASGFASGIYLYKIEGGSFIQTRKLILVK